MEGMEGMGRRLFDFDQNGPLVNPATAPPFDRYEFH